MTLPDTSTPSVAASYRGLFAEPVLRRLAAAVTAFITGQAR
jgi:hypothetical protein